MAAEKTLADDVAERELVVTRMLNAPRELVFEAWTNPEHLINWWGPRGFTNTFHEISVKKGGTWRFMMHGPDGTDYPNRIVFKKVVKPERLEYTHDSDRDNDPNAFEVTVTFEEMNGKTKLTMRLLMASAAALAEAKKFGAVEGGMQTVDRLEEALAKMEAGNSFVITRTLNAPRELVFKAFTEEHRLAEWWGPKGFKVVHSKVDLRPGGTFHYGMRSPNGDDMWGKFVYREIAPPHRLIYVGSFSDKDGNTTRHPLAAGWPMEMLTTITFTEENGKTTLTLSSVPINATEEERKVFEANYPGMEQGFGGTFSQLEEYLAR